MVPNKNQNILNETVGIIRIVMFLSMILTLILPAQQHQTSLTGLVFNNATKEKIIGANVAIVGSVFGASTDTSGRFAIHGLPSGSYEVRISALGYATVIVRDVRVGTSVVVDINVPLIEESIQMPEVVTIGGKQMDIPELSVSTRYLDYREIQHTAGAFDDVLRTITILPGIAQTRIDRNDLSVRGGSSSENLSLIDGFELDNINHFATQGSGSGSTTFLNLDFVESSFFSGGGFGVRYGDKLSSVLSIDMRDGRIDRLRVKTTLSATQVGMNLDGPITDNTSFLFSARRSYLEPLFKAYDFSFAPVFYDLLGKAVYRIGSSDKLEVLGIGVIDRMTRFDETPQKKEKNDRNVFSKQTRALTGITWKHGMSYGAFYILIQHSYADYLYSIEGVSNTLRPLLAYASSEQETSIKGDALIELFRFTELNIGGGAKRVLLNSDFYLRKSSSGFIGDSPIPAYDTKTNLTGYKAFSYIQISRTFGDIVLTAGIRDDYFSLIRENNVLAPRLSASIALFTSTTLHASVGQYIQSPAYCWLTGNSYNKHLTHMKMDQYVLGIEHYLQSDLLISFEAYDKQYNNYPVSLTRPYIVMVNSGTEVGAIEEAYTSFGLDFLESSGTGSSKGIEFFLQKKISETPYYGRVSVTYSDTRFKALDGVSRPSSFDQRWRIAISGGYIFNEHWECNAAFHLATGRPYTPFQYKDGVTYFKKLRSDYNTTRVKTNHGLDIRVTRRWEAGSVMITTFLDIQNVYNLEPDEPPGWNLSTMTPEKTQTLGIVPSIGVSVEF